jgi:hypothetical protein
MPFELIDLGASRSIPADDVLRGRTLAGAEATLVVGGNARHERKPLGTRSVREAQ